MRLLLVLTVFTMIAAGRCADAGVIIDVPAMQERVTDDTQTLLVAMCSAEQSSPHPIQVEQGDSDSLQGVAAIMGSTVAPSAALLHGVTPRPDSPLLWRIRLVNGLLPPSPDLNGLLKPS